ncbi:MAG: MmcQ/YjbR family DNA-binding protein [Cyclobacteriaceae bacterium]
MNVEELERFCLSLPAVTEDVKWDNDLVFSVGGKMFCVTSLELPYRVSFKVPDHDFDELSSRDGFMPAPYLARAKWVLVSHPEKLKRRELEDFVRQSYELIKMKLTLKMRKDLGIDN